MTPDLDQAEAYIRALTGSATTRMTFQTCDDNADRKESNLRIWAAKKARGEDGQKDPFARTLHGTLGECVDHMAYKNWHGAGVFALVQQGNFRARTKKDIVAVRALFVDDDDGALPPGSARLLAPPSFSVASRNGWHHYWLVKPGMSCDEFEHAQSQLAAYYKTDARMADCARVMRLPGFFHRKKEPFLVKMVDM